MSNIFTSHYNRDHQLSVYIKWSNIIQGTFRSSNLICGLDKISTSRVEQTYMKGYALRYLKRITNNT